MKTCLFLYGIAIICCAGGAPRWLPIVLAVLGLASILLPPSWLRP